MSSQYSFAPYQDPPEDIPAHEREQAAFTSASHYSSEGGPSSTVVQGQPFLGSGDEADDRINQYETSLPIRYYTSNDAFVDLCIDWTLKLLRLIYFPQ